MTDPSHPISAGLHHVTAIAGDPRRNLAFYQEALGLRLVKRTVNFDDPYTYHLYYGDEVGAPGTIMTFFPWPQAAQGRAGLGQASATAFLVPQPDLSFWIKRLDRLGIPHGMPVLRFGRPVLPLHDPDGMVIELIADPACAEWPVWRYGSVPAEQALRGLAGVTLMLADPAPTATLLENVLGYQLVDTQGARQRFCAQQAGPGHDIELLAMPDAIPGRMGRGSIHHIAFRASDDGTQATMARRLRDTTGLTATPQTDRVYFRSVYFREPGGVLFEIATDSPGFSVDESVETLGKALKLPSWYEAQRAEIEANLPRLD
jgi:glyoxalase family protein